MATFNSDRYNFFLLFLILCPFALFSWPSRVAVTIGTYRLSRRHTLGTYSLSSSCNTVFFSNHSFVSSYFFLRWLCRRTLHFLMQFSVIDTRLKRRPQKATTARTLIALTNPVELVPVFRLHFCDNSRSICALLWCSICITVFMQWMLVIWCTGKSCYLNGWNGVRCDINIFNAQNALWDRPFFSTLFLPSVLFFFSFSFYLLRDHMR